MPTFQISQGSVRPVLRWNGILDFVENLIVIHNSAQVVKIGSHLTKLSPIM